MRDLGPEKGFLCVGFVPETGRTFQGSGTTYVKP